MFVLKDNHNLKLKEEFGEFFIENYPKVKMFAQQILMSEEDAKDVSQDIFLKLMDLPDIWRDKDRINSYLFKMTKNHIFNLIKRRKMEREYYEKLAHKNILTEEFGIDDCLSAKETELIILHAIEEMPEKRRTVFRMSRFDDKSNREIAELLDMSVRTVERHLYLALADLKKRCLP